MARALQVTQDQDWLVTVDEELKAAKQVLKKAKLAEVDKRVSDSRSGAGPSSG